MRRIVVVLLATALFVIWPLASARGSQPAGSAKPTVRDDFNGDSFPDLAIGVPDERLGGAEATGVVHVLYGSPAGLTATGEPAVVPRQPRCSRRSRTGRPLRGCAGSRNAYQPGQRSRLIPGAVEPYDAPDRTLTPARPTRPRRDRAGWQLGRCVASPTVTSSKPWWRCSWG